MTGMDAEMAVYSYIRASRLMTDPKRPNGTLLMTQRPANSDKEDVIVRTLALTAHDMQKGTINVNIFVPNKLYTVTAGGEKLTMRDQPDLHRLNELSALVKESIEGFVWDKDYGYGFEIAHVITFPDADSNSHFINVRLNLIAVGVGR